MRTISPSATVFIATILTMTFAIAAFAQARKAAPAARPPTAAAPKPAGAAYQNQAFAPGFDDLMTMLVQPRHVRLYYAGSAKNWELAAAEARDLRSSFDRIAQTIPNYEGNDVSLSVRNFILSRLNAVDAAIAQGNSQQFAASYKELTAGCNECHTYMEHPFLVIQNPEAPGANSTLSDQNFRPRP